MLKYAYIAGTMSDHALRSDIIENIIDNGFEVLDPATHGLKDEQAYPDWDLAAIRRSTVVVAYMSPANPSGYGLSLEVGYAYGIGAPVIFVDFMGDDWRSKYFGMVRAVSKVVRSLDSLTLALVSL